MNENQETCYSHCNDEDYMEIAACERWSIGMVRRLKKQRPDEVKILAENPDGSLVAHMPKSWMRILPPRKVEMSDESKRELVKRLKAAREVKGSQG